MTGGNRGIGLEVCRKLVQHGKPVLLTARSAEAAEQAAQQLRGRGSVDVQAFALEAGDAASINQLVKSLEHYDQNIDLLVGINLLLVPPDLDGSSCNVYSCLQHVMADDALHKAVSPLDSHSACA